MTGGVKPKRKLAVRIDTAKVEYESLDIFDYIVNNEQAKLDKTLDVIESIIEAEHHRVHPRRVPVMTEQPQEPTTEAQRERIRIKMPQAKPVATISLIVFTTILYIFQYLQTTTNNTDTLFLLGGKINVLISAGQVWRLITPVFLHGSIAHLGFNMYALYIIGRNLERFLRAWTLPAALLPGGLWRQRALICTLPRRVHWALQPRFSPFLAAEGVFIYGNRRLFGPQRTKTDDHQSGRGHAGQPFVRPHPRFSTWIAGGHIGGILAGIFFAWKAGPILQIKGQPPFFRDGRYPQKERGLAHHADRPWPVSLSSLSCLPSLAKPI